MSIFNETQQQRDLELSEITKTPIEIIKKYKIASPDSIRIFNNDNDVIPKSKEEMELLYKKYKSLNIIAYLKTLMFTSISNRHKELYSFIKNTKQKVCLDFGSGVGTHSIMLAEQSNVINILDVPGPLLEFTKKRLANRNIKFTAYNNDDDLPNNTFEAIICTDVLEHVFDPIFEIDRMHKSMKIGGLLHLHVSEMEKDSSGHFSSSINIWKSKGKSYIKKYFDKIGETIYVKKG